jgi:hypothetical protein
MMINKLITFSFLIILFLCGCKKNKNEENIMYYTKYLEIKRIEDSIRLLDPIKLKKMHTRGCVHNCWDFVTASKIFRFEKELNDLGASLVWNYKTNEYIIILNKNTSPENE